MNKQKTQQLKKRNTELGGRISRFLRGNEDYQKRNKSAYTRARRELFFSNEGLVFGEQHKLNRYDQDYEDKCQELALAQWEATRDFHPRKGKFSTKSRLHMNQRLKRWRYRQIREVHGTIPLPILSVRFRITDYLIDLDEKLGRESSPGEAAVYVQRRLKKDDIKYVDVKPYHIVALRELERRVILDVQPLAKDQNSVYDLSVSNETDPGNSEQQSDLVLKMMRVVDNGLLTDRERHCLKSTTGLGGVTKRTYEEVGKEIGTSRERVRQIRVIALSKVFLRMNPQVLDSPEYTKALKPYEADVLRHFFGYYGEPKSLEEIGELYEKPAASVRRSYKSAFLKVRTLLSQHKSLKSVD